MLKMKEGIIINDTRIKYLLVASGKLYKVIDIDFWELKIEATETDLDISDVPEEEVFGIEDFKDFRIRLNNWRGNVVDFEAWVERKKKS